MSLIVVFFCLLAVFAFYYGNNPLRHGRSFMNRRFFNWLPLGMTYAARQFDRISLYRTAYR
jgi:OPA family glycerol-3-phosphate transporter-like MFS transporter